jgi:hypothetical protein
MHNNAGSVGLPVPWRAVLMEQSWEAKGQPSYQSDRDVFIRHAGWTGLVFRLRGACSMDALTGYVFHP